MDFCDESEPFSLSSVNDLTLVGPTSTSARKKSKRNHTINATLRGPDTVGPSIAG